MMVEYTNKSENAEYKCSKYTSKKMTQQSWLSE